MPDITMCKGTNCPKRDSCYRHTAEANPYRQSYFVDAPYDKENDLCEYYSKVDLKGEGK